MKLLELIPAKRAKRLKHDGLFKRYLFDDYDQLTAEQRLWRCVLILTGLDAVEFVTGHSIISGASREELRDAFLNVMEQTLDFDKQAEWSGLDADTARAAILDEIIDCKNFAPILESFRNDELPVFSSSFPFRKLVQIEIEYEGLGDVS